MRYGIAAQHWHGLKLCRLLVAPILLPYVFTWTSKAFPDLEIAFLMICRYFQKYPPISDYNFWKISISKCFYSIGSTNVTFLSGLFGQKMLYLVQYHIWILLHDCFWILLFVCSKLCASNRSKTLLYCLYVFGLAWICFKVAASSTAYTLWFPWTDRRTDGSIPVDLLV